jgi:hypothetical protein
MKSVSFAPSARFASFVASMILWSPAPGAPLRYVVPAGPNNQLLGSSLVALGDLDSDGIRDFAIGDPGYSAPGPDASVFAGSGQVLVVSGRDGSLLYELFGTPAAGQAFGTSLAALDANGDGVTDLAVGAPGGSGAVWIYSGTDGLPLQTINAVSPGAGSLFGHALANAGDQNDDGKDDLFIGSPGADALGGRVSVVSGRDGTLIFELATGVDGMEFGFSVAAVEDLSGDDRPDLAVGAPGFSAALGRVQLLASTDGDEIAVVAGLVADGRLGSRIGNVDDRDEDGIPDLVVGSGSGGSAFLLSGETLDVITDLSLAGAAADLPVVPGGSLDVDFDGFTEILIGYPGANPLAKVDVIPAPAAPEPNVYEAAEAGTGLGSAITVIPGLGFAIGEPLVEGGAVYLYSTLPDSDGDGVPDVDDCCPNSILDPTVIFGNVDTGVENRVNPHGCSLADLFARLKPASGWKNHGQFVSSVVRLVKRLERHQEIAPWEARALRNGAARSNVGKPVKKPKAPAKPAQPPSQAKPQAPAKPAPANPQANGKPSKPGKSTAPGQAKRP